MRHLYASRLLQDVAAYNVVTISLMPTSIVYKALSTLCFQYKWFNGAQDQTGWRQLIAPVWAY